MWALLVLLIVVLLLEIMMVVLLNSLSKDLVVWDFKDIEHREFGFNYVNGFVRKKQFNSVTDLVGYIERNQPLDCFVSIARYNNPGKMEGWLGSDLFFDIDISGGNVNRVYNEALSVFDVLKSDFGLDNVVLNVSGSKGYHVLVFDDVIQRMSSSDRREVVDYLMVKYDAVHIDAPSSCDIHRLRRLEGTRNSKSGLFCKRLKTYNGE